MRHAPRRFASVLEPSAGNGALISQLRDRIESNSATVTAVDINASRLNQVRGRLKNVPVDLIHADFLQWSANFHVPKFDLIVTNPPFLGKRNFSVPICPTNETGAGCGGGRRVPLEVAFLLRCIRLLKEGGRLLSVLPASIISSDRAVWLRKLIQEVGNVRFVHELAKGSFPRLEARTYLFVFDKSIDRRTIRLQNHDLTRPANLLLPWREAAEGRRLDFGFHQAAQAMEAMRERPRFKWQRITEIADVIRGDVESPISDRATVHTNSALPCFWNGALTTVGRVNRQSGRAVQSGDLLLSRVGRNCTFTLGASRGMEGRRCSDCVILIRPQRAPESLRILLALRVVLRCEVLRKLLERGTGASYVTVQDLLAFSIPFGVDELFPEEFEKYRRAYPPSNRRSL